MGQELDDRFEQQVLTTGFIHARGIGLVQGQVREETRDLGPDPAREIVGRDDVGGAQQPSQRLGPGRIRDALDATAPDDVRLPGDPGRELLEQAGLPDAHLPANEHERSGVGHAAQRLAEGRERGLTPDEIRGPLAAPHDSSLWAIRSERATSASRAPTHRFRFVRMYHATLSVRTLSANWSGAQWFARPVPCKMASVAEHGDGVCNLRGHHEEDRIPPHDRWWWPARNARCRWGMGPRLNTANFCPRRPPASTFQRRRSELVQGRHFRRRRSPRR